MLVTYSDFLFIPRLLTSYLIFSNPRVNLALVSPPAYSTQPLGEARLIALMMHHKFFSSCEKLSLQKNLSIIIYRLAWFVFTLFDGRLFLHLSVRLFYLPLIAYVGGAADAWAAAVVTLRRNVLVIFPSRNLALKGGALCMNSTPAFVFLRFAACLFVHR